MNIKFYSASIIALFLFLVITGEVLGQTYTTTGLSTNWNDPAAWVRTGECGVVNNGIIPPRTLNSGNACPVNIVINHPLTFTGNTNLGSGYMSSLTINEGGNLTFTGNVTISNNNNTIGPFNILVQGGGVLNVNATLTIQNGAILNTINTENTNPNSTINVNRLNFNNNGSGQTINVGANTVFNVSTSTNLNGNSTLNIEGAFNTNSFNSSNNSGNSVNLSENGTIKALGDMRIDGFPFNLTGNASAVVGGNLNITNNGGGALNLASGTNFIVLSRGSNLNGRTPSGGGCYQTPENGNTCSSSACLTVNEVQHPDGSFTRTFTFICNTDWTIPGASDGVEPVDEAEILVVAGGGGGGRGDSAGGGGAGGLIYRPSETLPFGTTIPIIVGTGGVGSINTNTRGQNGSNSSFLTLTAIGGGGGGSNGTEINGANGGSGGGGANSNGNGGNNTANQGNVGGNGNNSGGNNRSGGGGGGAGSFATNVPNGTGNGGNGGNGIQRNISGINIFYSGGGAGTGRGNPGSGGSGVGGNGNNSGNGGNGSSPGSGGGAGSNSGGNGANGIIIIRQSFRILPVEYLEINASFSTENRSSTVSWATAKEWENSHFEIERALDNVKSFEKIGEVEGMGYSDDRSDYSYTDDKLPLLGGMAYYRLKQVDFSGDFTYSEVIGVRIIPTNITKGVWRAYPNPNTGDSFSLDLINNSEYQGEILSIRLVTPIANQKPIEGKDLKEISQTIADILKKSPHGVYILEVTWGQKLEYIKILKK